MFRTLLLLIPFPRKAITRIAERPSWPATAFLASASALITAAFGYYLSVVNLPPDLRSQLKPDDIGLVDPWLWVAVTLPYCLCVFAVAVILVHRICRALGGRGALVTLATVQAYILGVDILIWAPNVALLLVGADALSNVLSTSAGIWKVVLTVMALSHVYRLTMGKALLAVFVAALVLALLFVALLLGLRVAHYGL